MGTEDNVEAHEKASAAAATVPDDTIDSHKDTPQVEEEKEEIEPEEDVIPISSRSTQVDKEGPGQEQEQNNDLEASRTSASAGPPYSAFSPRKKRFIIFMSSFAGFFSPLSATIYFPALNTLSRELNVSHGLINLTLTSYMIFQGLAPTFMGDLADMSGRRPAYIIGFLVYIGACTGIALQNSFAALFILRCFQSSGSSSFVALGSGTAADVSTSAERGTYMGWVTSGMLIGPAVGPIIGGVLAEFLGWRAIFWFLIILAGTYLIPFLILYPETGRNVVGNGSIPPQRWNMSLLSYLALRKTEKDPSRLERVESRQSARDAREALAKKRKLKFPNPLSTLKIVKEKDIGLLLLYNSLVYTAFYDVTASLPYLFEKIYGFNALQVGLAYIPFGVGSFLAPVMNGRLLDWNFRRVAKQEGITVDKRRVQNMKGFPLERARVPIALPLVLIGDLCVLTYGWVMQYETHLAIPLVLTFIMGVTLTGSFNVMNVMLVDNYPKSPATATAGNNLCRCLMGAGGTAVIIYMIEGMGTGWCFTFVAGVVLVTSSILFVLLKWGPGWRLERLERMEAEEKAKEAAAT